jgi:phosphoribosylformylglycinamidine cyclo-ligase
MSNGLTLARKVLMHESYNVKYPFLSRDEHFYQGDYFVGSGGAVNLGEEIVSPTRQWALIIRRIIDELIERDADHLLHGIVMNTGGGATKILNIGQGIHYVKKMPEMPLIFQQINVMAQDDWRNIFTTFNCGVGIDIIGSSAGWILGDVLESVSEWSGVKLFCLGKCESAQGSGNRVTLNTKYGTFSYSSE